jgi:hypothetical protein
MRTFEDGKIKPDCFAEERLLGFPPVCGVILIMVNRFHNYVVEQLALINENGRFSKPNENPHRPQLHGEDLKAAWKKRDNDLFQTGRLVTCGLYINITVYDYVSTPHETLSEANESSYAQSSVSTGQIPRGAWTPGLTHRSCLVLTAHPRVWATRCLASSVCYIGGTLVSASLMNNSQNLLSGNFLARNQST